MDVCILVTVLVHCWILSFDLIFALLGYALACIALLMTKYVHQMWAAAGISYSAQPFGPANQIEIVIPMQTVRPIGTRNFILLVKISQ
jgi:hypothetical protein